MGLLLTIYIEESIIEYKAKTRLLGVTVDQNLNWIPHLQEVVKSFANKLSLSKKSRFLLSHVCESFYLKVFQPSITYVTPVWGSVSQTELFKSLERQHCGAARIIFRFPSDMPTADVLAIVKCNTLTPQYKLSLIRLFAKVNVGMLPHALAEQLIIHSNRFVSRTKHGLIAPRFASNYVKNFIAYAFKILDF